MNEIFFIVLIANVLVLFLLSFKKITSFLTIVSSVLFLITTVILYFRDNQIFFEQNLYFSLFLWTTRFANYLSDKSHNYTEQSMFSKLKNILITWISMSLILWIPFSVTLFFIREETKWVYFIASFGLWFMGLGLQLLTNKPSKKINSLPFFFEIITWMIIYFILIWELSPIAATAGLIPFLTLLIFGIIGMIYSQIRKFKKKK